MAGKSYNPVEFKQDFMNLATTAPQEAADVAMKWRERFVNTTEQMKKSSEDLMEAGVGGGAAFLAGFLDGGWAARRDDMIKEWEEGGAAAADADLEEHPTPFSAPDSDAKDPTMVFGVVDKVLFGTLATAAVGISGIIGKKYSPIIISAAKGLGIGWAFSKGTGIGYKRAVKALAEEKSGEKAA